MSRPAAALLALLTLALAAPAAAEEAPQVEGFWAGDNPYDAGGVLAFRWRNTRPDPAERVWRVSVTQIALPDPETGEMKPVENGRTNFPGPGFQQDYKADANFLKDVPGPFWCWPPVKDPEGDVHWLTMDLLMHFAPEALAAEMKDARAALEAAKSAKVPDPAEVHRLEAGLRALEKRRLEENDRIRRGRYRVELLYQDPSSMGRLVPAAAPVEVEALGNWWDARKLNNLLLTLILLGALLWYITHAKRRELFLRRIPGIDAVEEAIGRATEMGRPVFYMTGINDIGSVSTMAAATILGEVAKKVAHYDTRLRVPHRFPITMTVCNEITREAYLEAGRPDAFQEDANFYVTDDQFGYAAAVDGMFMREKPAACFYMGAYFAESLLLAETGSASGAIQVAGTDSEHQLPFFITACDYTLIGEELYAASAYLSKEPVKVGTLRGQDVGKLILMVFLVTGTLLVTVSTLKGKPRAADRVLHLFQVHR